MGNWNSSQQKWTRSYLSKYWLKCSYPWSLDRKYYGNIWCEKLLKHCQLSYWNSSYQIFIKLAVINNIRVQYVARSQELWPFISKLWTHYQFLLSLTWPVLIQLYLSNILSNAFAAENILKTFWQMEKLLT